MKKLKFLILALGLIAAQGAVAVTLPSTSYTPYNVGDGDYSSGGVVYSGVKSTSGRFLSLGAIPSEIETQFEACITNYPGGENLQACQACVTDVWGDCSSACSGDNDCMDECDTAYGKYQNQCGRSLPLDAPLWFMLLLALGGGAKSLLPLLRKIKH